MAAVIVRPQSWSPPRPARPRAACPRDERWARERELAPPARRRVPRLDEATYRRRRLVAVLLLISCITVTVLGVSAAVGRLLSTTPAAASVSSVQPGASLPSPAVTSADPRSNSYVVRSGDTLWSIARQLQPEGDIRPLVDRLVQRNGGSSLQVGQRLDLDGFRG